MNWYSVKEKPLLQPVDELGNWFITEEANDTFLAAVPYKNTSEDDKILWWVHHCAIENGELVVIGEYDNESAGWSVHDIEFWMPVSNPKIILKNE